MNEKRNKSGTDHYYQQEKDGLRKPIEKERKRMPREIDMEAMDAKINAIKAGAEELHRMADAFPAIARNSARILSSTKMLEISLSDIVHLEAEQHQAWTLLRE